MNGQLIQRIRRCPNLPSLPAIAVQVLSLAQQEDADLAEIARLISKDPALSSKILRTVNSSFYGRSQNVSTISHALVLLGLQAVKTLALGFSLVSNLSPQKTQGFRHVVYWKRSIYAATAARSLATRLKLVEREEAFLVALLQDIGMLVLDAVLGNEYGPIHDKAASHAELPAEELKALGMTHAEIGGLLAGDWKLPAVLAIPIAHHHSPEKAGDPQTRKLAELVEVSGLCADVFVDEIAAQPIAEVRQLCSTRHQMSESDCDAMLEEIGRNTREIASLFEINLGKSEGFEDILKRANDALVSITTSARRGMLGRSRSADKAIVPAAGAGRDPVTGLADRNGMEAFLREQLGTATEPLSLVLIAPDPLKAQQQGHATAGRVIQAVAALLGSAVRPLDLAARLGEDELALALPGTPRATAAAIAESIRRAIAAKPLTGGTGDLRVTTSVGVACFEPAGPLKDAAHLLKAARLALDAARQAGRNCVRIFSLKSQTAAA